MVAKLLWLEKRVRPDIEPNISFLCTIVTNITKEEKEKLRRVFQYLKHTIYDKRIMVADSLSQFFTWVDAACGVHTELKMHTVVCMSFGYGIVHCKSRNQELNTKRSTEA